MTTKDNGGPAFPAMHFDLAEGEHGLTIRDWFAAKAMQAGFSGHIAHYGRENYWSPGDIASHAYEMADAMLKERQE